MTASPHDDWRLDQLERQVESLHREVRVFAPTAQQIGAVEHRQDAQGVQLTRQEELLHAIRDDQKSLFRAVERLRADMNGRLRALELWRAGLQALGRSFRWLPTLLGTVVGGTVTGVAVYVLTH